MASAEINYHSFGAMGIAIVNGIVSFFSADLYCSILFFIEAIELTAQDTSERFPLALIERIASGESAIKVFREYRELSQSDIAARAGVSKQYISQIENKERCGTVKLLKKIAKILHVELEDITH